MAKPKLRCSFLLHILMARARARSQLAGHWSLFTKASSSQIISSNNALLALTKRTHKHKKLKQGKVVIKVAQNSKNRQKNIAVSVFCLSSGCRQQLGIYSRKKLSFPLIQKPVVVGVMLLPTAPSLQSVAFMCSLE